MSREEILSWCLNEASENMNLVIPDEIFSQIDVDTAIEISSSLGSNTFVKLPKYEIEFFEWLKITDFAVWNDLWGNEPDRLYFVGASFLPLLTDKTKGFPICDLESEINYYFTEEMLQKDSSYHYIELVKDKFLRKEPLSLAQTLALEISMFPFDIWHFCYRRKANLTNAKKAIAELVEDQIVTHYRKASEIAEYIYF